MAALAARMTLINNVGRQYRRRRCQPADPFILDTSHTITSAGTLQASNGGTLEITNHTTIANTGTIEAGAGSQVDLSLATIDGGTLTGSGMFNIAGSSTINDNASLTGGVIGINSGQTLTLDDVTVSGSTIEAVAVYSFTNVNDPSAATGRFSFASQNFAINNAGEIIGNYADANGNYYGFIYSIGNGTVTPRQLSKRQPRQLVSNGPPGTTVTGINDSGEVVGYYNSGSGDFAFVESGDVYTTTERRGFALGINNSGEVVGVNYVGDNRGRRFSIQQRQLYQFERWVSRSGRHLCLRHQQFRPGSRRLLRRQRQRSRLHLQHQRHLHRYHRSVGRRERLWRRRIRHPRQAINNAGQVVGYYVDASGQTFTASSIVPATTPR